MITLKGNEVTDEVLNNLYELEASADDGNTSTKVTFITGKGEMESFTIPTVVAPAGTTVLELDYNQLNAGDYQLKGEDHLHVNIKSRALPKNKTNSFYYVGFYAIDKEEMKQPVVGEDKNNSEIHIITKLTGLAVAALKAKQENVKIKYSGGLPIEEYKKVGQEALQKLLGEHIVEFMDGPYAGKTVNIIIYDGKIRVEGVNSVLALSFDIKDKQIVQTPLVEKFGLGDYALGDLGAGTLDKAFYKAGQIDKNISTNEALKVNKPLGTNPYIDELMKKIVNIPEFEPIRSALGESNASPYRSREEFVKFVLEPGIAKIINGDKDVKFLVSWARIKNVDVTDIVLSVMKDYAETVKEELNYFWFAKAVSAESFALVGGGVLFGYHYFKDMNDFTLLDKSMIAESAYVTSRSYLIASFAE